MADLTFITLTWNSQAYVRGCLDSILVRCAADGLRPEVLVVDNGSGDRSVDIVNEFGRNYPDAVKLVALGRNRGTTVPRNLALKQARSPYLCILDSDTEFVSGSIRPVLDSLTRNPRLAIVAPRLVLPDGSTQHSVKRFPTFVDKLRKVPGILLGRTVARPDFYPSFPFTTSTRVDTAISACWFFRADLLSAVGLLDEGIFYAPEDVEFSARIWEAGLDIVYDPSLTLLHHTQQISHRRPFSRVSLSHVKGLLRHHRKHGGWFKRPADVDLPHPSSSGVRRRPAASSARHVSVS